MRAAISIDPATARLGERCSRFRGQLYWTAMHTGINKAEGCIDLHRRLCRGHFGYFVRTLAMGTMLKIGTDRKVVLRIKLKARD